MKTAPQAKNVSVELNRRRWGRRNRRLWLRRGLPSALLLLMAAAPAIGGTPHSDTPRVLQPLTGDTDSFATDINNRGQVSGRSEGATTTAVRWDRDGDAMPLYPLEADRDSYGEAINNRGEVVGISRSGEDPCVRPADLVEIFKDTAVVWDGHGRRRVLQPLDGDVESRGYGINNRGIAVGISLGPRRPSDCGASFTAVIWDREGNPTPLPSPSTVLDETFGFDINNSGAVAGFNNTLDGSAFNATVWNRRGVPTNLPTPYVNDLELANGLNNRGDLVGTEFINFVGLFWDKDGNVEVLAPLAGEFFSTAVDINNRGQAVGSSFSGGFVETAVVWDKHGVPTALPPRAGDTTSSGMGINDPGHVAGNSSGANGTTAVVWR